LAPWRASPQSEIEGGERTPGKWCYVVVHELNFVETPMAMVKEFKEFLLKQNVIALAIAVVVGTALNTLVKALVDDFIMPVVAAIGPGGDWQKATWNVGSVKFGLGDFIAAVINFIIIGFVAWRISKIFIKPEGEAPKKKCPFCKLEMDAAATRCPHCTSELGAAA
jgi:large conductance mechanosensitive channel